MTSRLEAIMANLDATLRRIAWVRGVTMEAPREDASAEPFKTADLPHIWCWEGEESIEYGATNLLLCTLPVAIEGIYPSRDGVRARGRRYKADIQQAVAADFRRGLDPDTGAAYAIDTKEVGSDIAPLPQAGYACVHLDYLVTYARHIQNPFGLVAP